MFARCRSLAVSLVVLGLTGCGAADTPAACDRACLISIGDSYLAALIAHEPSLAPLADDLAFVENTTPTQVGRGVWVSASAIPSDYRIHVPDETAGTIGMMTLIGRRMPEGIPPALLAVRLKIEGGLITEAEHLVDDVPEVVNLASLVAPRPNLIAVVPENERMSRADLIAIAASYYAGLDTSDSSLVPFGDDCERQENGMITAAYYLEPASFDSEDVNGNSPPPVARDCAGQMDSARFAYIDSIDNRRVFAADPLQGLVMGLSHFRQSMTRGPLEMIAADGSRVLWEEQREPYDLPAAHIFKITNGQLHEVEAIGIFLPYQSPTGWE